MKRRISLMLLAGLMSAGAPLAQASDDELARIVREVLVRQPDLKLSALAADSAEAGVEAIEGMLDPRWNARVGISDEKAPTVSAFQPSTTRSATLGAGLRKKFASGGELSASLSYSRTDLVYQSAFASQLALFNPAYRGQIDLSYRHPLLRGADNPDYRLGRQAAEARAGAARLGRQLSARALALAAMNAYFQLAADTLQLELAREGVARAKRLVAYQKTRERFGLIEEADRLQAEALLAARKSDLADAEARLAADRANLNRLMLRPADAPLRIRPPKPAGAPLPDADRLVRIALERRPESRQLALELKAAEAELEAARATDRMQLDLVLEAGTRALDTSAAPAFGKSLSPKDRFLGIAVEMSDSIGGRAERAAIRQALIARERLIEQRRKLEEDIRTEIETALTRLASGRPALARARARARAEARKFEAEMRRYREGRSSTATVIQFEGELAAARMQARMQALSLALAERQLAWASGRLLDELGIEVPR